MPFHRIGEIYEPIAPSTAEAGILNTDAVDGVSDEDIERWYQDAFLALKDDPYIHFDLSDPNHGANFRVIAPSNNAATLLPVNALNHIDQATMLDKRVLFRAAQEGQLFYYDASLGEHGGMRQIYTKTVNVQDQKEYELCVTGKVDTLPNIAPAEPQRPAFWKYLLYPFFAKQFREYQAQKKAFDKVGTYIKAFDDGATNLIFQASTGDSSVNAQAREKQAARIREHEKKHQARHSERDQSGRELAPYKKKNLEGFMYCIKTFAMGKVNVKNPNSRALTVSEDQLAALSVFAIASPELHIIVGKNKDQTTTIPNDPNVNYPKIVVEGYFKNHKLDDKTNGFRRNAIRALNAALDDAIDNHKFTKLGKLIADGLKQNNKLLSEQKSLSDFYTSGAELGQQILDLLDSNPELLKVVKAELGADSKEITIARNAKAVSDLRLKALEEQEKLLQDFRERGEDGKPKSYGSNEALCYVCQASLVDCQMRLGKFDLEKNGLAQPGQAKLNSSLLQGNPMLRAFRYDVASREKLLTDPVKMANLFNDAFTFQVNKMKNDTQRVAEVIRQTEKSIQVN